MPALRPWLRRLPPLIGAALIALGAAQVMWNGTLGNLAPWLHWHVKIPLGALPDNPPPLSVGTFLDGRWQEAVAHSIGPRTILYTPSVRWKNQIFYSLLGMSGAKEIGMGRGHELFQWAYVRSYCEVDLAKMAVDGPRWAARLRALQDALTARGKRFLYVITPSKLQEMPGILPKTFPCPHGEEHDEKLRMWRAELQAAGVRYADGVLSLKHAEGRYPVDFFPRGGTHWNLLGASLAAQDITRLLDGRGARLSPFTFRVAVSHHPKGSDRDIYDTLNLQLHADNYAVPVMTYVSTPPAPCVPERIAEVGGSFLFRVNEALDSVACPPVIRMYWYWDERGFLYRDGRRTQFPITAPRRTEDILNWSETMILEENVATIPDSVHGQDLMALLDAPVDAPADAPVSAAK